MVSLGKWNLTLLSGGKSVLLQRHASQKFRRFLVPYPCHQDRKSKVWFCSFSSPLPSAITFSLLLSLPSLAEGSHYRLCSLADLLFYWESTGMFCAIIFIWRSSLQLNSWNDRNTSARWAYWCNITAHTVFWKEIWNSFPFSWRNYLFHLNIHRIWIKCLHWSWKRGRLKLIRQE